VGPDPVKHTTGFHSCIHRKERNGGREGGSRDEMDKAIWSVVDGEVDMVSIN